MERSFANIIRKRLRGRRLLWPAGMLLRYLRIKSAYASGEPLCLPLYASLSVTRLCNLRCPICRVGDGPACAPQGGELTLDEFKAVADELREMGTEVIGLTGGEPLLREDLPALVAHIKARGMIVHLSTNGTLLDDRRAAGLLESGVDWVNVSVDGASAKKHDEVRGAGSFGLLMDNVRRFLRLRDARGGGTKLNLVMVLNKSNLEEAPALVELAKRLGADGAGFMPFHPLTLSGAAVDRLLVTDLAQAEKVTGRLLALKKSEPLMDNTGGYLRLFMGCFRREPSPLTCYALMSTLAVDAVGNVYPCFPRLQTDRAFGNVRGGSLRKVLGTAAAGKARLEVRDCRACYWNCHTELNLVFNRLLSALLGG